MSIVAKAKKRLRPASGPKVETTAGTIAGLAVDGGRMHHFFGIPFAAPPEGERRWAAPVPPERWEGVRPCVKFGPAAYQRVQNFEQFIAAMAEGLGFNRAKRKAMELAAPRMVPAQSEDCLTLNVRAPAHGRKLPVMVWIHGGDHTDGSGSHVVYQSDALPERGCVLVTINYRLGLFGFYAHPELKNESPDGICGNYGLLDQIAALAWVRDNIAGFGGDPTRVTIFGESAGGQAVLNLMSAPAARGLFHRGISQSPSDSGRWLHLDRPVLGFDSATAASKTFADRVVGVESGQLERLRAIPADELSDHYREHEDLGRHFYPVVDGALLPEPPMTCFSNSRQAPVPLMIGYNADEGTLVAQMMHPAGPEFAAAPGGTYSPEEIRAAFTLSFGSTVAASQVFAAYPGIENGDLEPRIRYTGDHMFGCHVDHASRTHSEAGHPVFRYHYRAVPPSPKQTAGAYHAAEVVNVFDSTVPLMPSADDEHLLTREMGDRWYAFAATSSPAFPGRAEWAPYTLADPVQMVFNRPESHAERCQAEAGLDLLRERIVHLNDLVSKPLD